MSYRFIPFRASENEMPEQSLLITRAGVLSDKRKYTD